jgi:hypothetical protein
VQHWTLFGQVYRSARNEVRRFLGQADFRREFTKTAQRLGRKRLPRQVK